MEPPADGADAAFRGRVVAYYATNNPSNLDAVNDIVIKYRGREADLWRKLHKKYGAPPKAAAPAPAPAAANGDPLDFRSPAFDAALALRSDARPPFPDAKPLDNITKCKRLLPAWCEDHDSRVKVGAHHVVAAPSVSASRGAALLGELADPLREGPFSVLWRALSDRAAVSVVVRRARTVRGRCVGLLKAFDKHMNLVLIDATETFTPPRRTGTARPVTRHLQQMFIRGDAVVLVGRAYRRADTAPNATQQGEAGRGKPAPDERRQGSPERRQGSPRLAT
ncbi:hypothetical protein M885DRAFT_185556 [Pelagophyceae sp. CCMP2097]|nr:hypothetical protein M885DRAFT_185556 [Pelagophyceae sp. CCMP2097]|mmetsp:Transcript_15458/g.53896  ORF Transcript_15458/g.53896 Transcript_15458/m.53896 type:complete len:280 (-) Transcript_15458:29-868(-)